MLYDSYNLIYLYGLNGYLKWEYNGDIYIYTPTDTNNTIFGYIWVCPNIEKSMSFWNMMTNDGISGLYTHTPYAQKDRYLND